MKSWIYWKDSELPDGIRNGMENLRDTFYGKPEDHNASHTKDSHIYSLYRLKYGGFAVRIKHGGGIFWLVTHYEKTSGMFLLNQASQLTDARLWELLDFLYVSFMAGRDHGQEQTEAEYREAFAEGRLKKRKIRNADACRIWIEARKIAH